MSGNGVINLERVKMWKTLKDYPLYEINKFGQVKNKKTGHILKPKIDKYGYYVLGLYYNKNKYYPTVHRLLAKTFITI